MIQRFNVSYKKFFNDAKNLKPISFFVKLNIITFQMFIISNIKLKLITKYKILDLYLRSLYVKCTLI